MDAPPERSLILLAVLLGCAPAGPPNVLVVSMDTVRADRTSLGSGAAGGAAGSMRDTTPNLWALARQGAWWPDAQAVGNESLYSHAALFTGRYPSEVAVPDYGSYALPADVPTLASVLAAYGYDTAAFTGGGHIIADFGFGHGFATFHAPPGQTSFRSFFQSVPAATAYIDAHTRAPWFVFVHGYDAHTPYVQPGPFAHRWGAEGTSDALEAMLADANGIERVRGRSYFPDRTPFDFMHAVGLRLLSPAFYTLPADPQPGERVVTLDDAAVEHVRAHYDAGLTYADVWLGALLAHVDLERTLVIVVSDHGEDLLDHGYANHRAGLWDSTLHVPLVVAGPGFGGGAQSGRVDLRSVLPTVLRAAGATLPAGVTAPALQDHPDAPYRFAEGVMDMVSVRSPEGRLTIAAARLAAGAPDLAVRDAADPSFTWFDNADRPVDAPDPSAREALRQAIVGWRTTLTPASVTGAPVSPEVRDALRAQGYWSPGDTVPAPVPAANE